MGSDGEEAYTRWLLLLRTFSFLFFLAFLFLACVRACVRVCVCVSCAVYFKLNLICPELPNTFARSSFSPTPKSRNIWKKEKEKKEEVRSPEKNPKWSCESLACPCFAVPSSSRLQTQVAITLPRDYDCRWTPNFCHPRSLNLFFHFLSSSSFCEEEEEEGEKSSYLNSGVYHERVDHTLTCDSSFTLR